MMSFHIYYFFQSGSTFLDRFMILRLRDLRLLRLCVIELDAQLRGGVFRIVIFFSFLDSKV